MAKLTVITPSVRKDALEMVERCLSRQAFHDFEWLVVSPEDYGFGKWTKDPEKREGDFYRLNGAWNKALKKARGELFVSIVDGLYFPPETLQRLWDNYTIDPMSCVSLTGDQYSSIENGKPENRVWIDPRKRIEVFYKCPPYDLELCIASLPMKGVKEVGFFDETFDRFPAWSEKDLACRLAAIGYTCYIDSSVEYRAIYHERLFGNKWDEMYPQSTAYFHKCYREIQEGKRLRLDYLGK